MWLQAGSNSRHDLLQSNPIGLENHAERKVRLSGSLVYALECMHMQQQIRLLLSYLLPASICVLKPGQAGSSQGVFGALQHMATSCTA